MGQEINMNKPLFLRAADREQMKRRTQYRYKTTEHVQNCKHKRDMDGFFIPFAMFRPYNGSGLLCEVLGMTPTRRMADLRVLQDYLMKEAYEHEIEMLMCQMRLHEFAFHRRFCTEDRAEERYTRKMDGIANADAEAPEMTVPEMTGNDTINARYLNENSFDFVPVFKIFINTNYLPNVNDMTLFQSGRLKIIPFNRHFEEGEQDQGLKGQFAQPENLSGIFNWCLEGYRKFCQQGLETPDAVKKATEEYKDDSDRIGQFIEAWIVEDKNAELRTSAAYQLYAKWCEENGYTSENQKNFKNAIGLRYTITRKRPKDGGSKTTVIIGCKFREVEDGAEDVTVQEAYKSKDDLL